jgi:polyisoprenoid-binding protein YceI
MPGKSALQRGLFAMALIGLMASPGFAQTEAGRYVLNKDHSRIGFSIGHFVVSSTEGRFTQFDGKLEFPPQTPERGAVTIHVSTGSIDTGIAARDDHLRTADFFDAARFPLASFESTGLARTSNTAGTLTGQFSLHGVTRPLTLAVTLRTTDLNAARLEFSASTTLKRSDYGMTQYQGVIGDDVRLTIDAAFDKQG